VGRDLDDPATTLDRRRILREKPFLRRLYGEWYRLLAASLPPLPGPVVELGSGAGFLAEVLPGVISTDIQALPGLGAVADGCQLPFAAESLRGLVFTNVLHHMREPLAFLAEATRVVKPGGVLTMVEPWVTPWSRVVYRHLHYEPFDPAAPPSLAAGGPLSTANDALAWIVFAREWPTLTVLRASWELSVCPLMPFAFLASGGLSLRGLAPAWSYRACRWLEQGVGERSLAMFAVIRLERRR
jgi:SAM-dependent methyltransferase